MTKQQLLATLLEAVKRWRHSPPSYYTTNQAVRDAWDAYEATPGELADNSPPCCGGVDTPTGYVHASGCARVEPKAEPAWNPSVQCSCGWHGKVSALNHNACPDCRKEFRVASIELR